jgi:prephenate dehydratase
VSAFASPRPRIAFLGPPGTFSEEALLSESDFADADVIPLPTFPDVVAAVEEGRVDLGFLALENSIEGTVNANLDALIFERDLLIVREVVFTVQQNLLAPPGTRLDEVKRVVSFPHATAQCRGWLATNLPGVEEIAATSTAEGSASWPRNARPGRRRSGPAWPRRCTGSRSSPPTSKITMTTRPGSC